MILIGLGTNLKSSHGSRRDTLDAAVSALAAAGVTICRRSKYFESEPVPRSDQPWFLNAVVEIKSELAPDALLELLHRIEDDFGRTREKRWEARVLDLDLIAHGDLVLPGLTVWQKTVNGDPQAVPTELIVPHPRMHERRFVLLPLLDIEPDWRHPVMGRRAADLLAGLTTVGIVRPVA